MTEADDEPTRAGDREPGKSSVGWRSERGRNGGIDRVPVDHLAGDLWLCGKHLVGPDHGSVLERVGAAAIVCLTEAHELADRYPDYLAWLRSDDPRALWHPVHDMCAPDVESAELVVGVLRDHLSAGDDVVVHCGAGIGRAGTVAAAVLVDGGLAPDVAVAVVAANRPMAGPEAGEQRELLDALADRRTLRRRDRPPA